MKSTRPKTGDSSSSESSGIGSLGRTGVFSLDGTILTVNSVEKLTKADWFVILRAQGIKRHYDNWNDANWHYITTKQQIAAMQPTADQYERMVQWAASYLCL